MWPVIAISSLIANLILSLCVYCLNKEKNSVTDEKVKNEGRRKDNVTRKNELDIRETAISERETAINTRENEISDIEMALNEREKALDIKEAIIKSERVLYITKGREEMLNELYIKELSRHK